MNNYRGKVVWITGASSGIGKETALEFAKLGSKLVLTAIEEDLLKTVKNECINLGGEALALPYDLSDTTHIPDLVLKVISHFGQIDLLFNNAGISQRDKILDTNLDVTRKIMEVNYFAPVVLAKEVLPYMIKQNSGQIAVTTSIAGKFGFPLRSAYSSSKHALYGFFETLREEYHANNISVTFVCPGRVKTNISKYALTGDGKSHGKMDAGQAGGVTAHKAAKQILKAVSKNKYEVLIGGKELIPVYLKRFIPCLFHKVIRNVDAK